MKNVLTKIKAWFKSKKINLNLVITLLVVVSVIGGYLLYTNIQSKKEKAKIENIEKEVINKATTRSRRNRYVADSIDNSTKEDYEKINQNEKIDWSDLYTSDPDSVAKDILEWHSRPR